VNHGIAPAIPTAQTVNKNQIASDDQQEDDQDTIESDEDILARQVALT
jgi:hypothetical protein